VGALELSKLTYRVVLMYVGKKCSYSLDTGSSDIAEALRGGVEKTLTLLKQVLFKLPEGADLITFIRAGGKVEARKHPLWRKHLDEPFETSEAPAGGCSAWTDFPSIETQKSNYIMIADRCWSPAEGGP
jgi:hypothetical protein